MIHIFQTHFRGAHHGPFLAISTLAVVVAVVVLGFVSDLLVQLPPANGVGTAAQSSAAILSSAPQRPSIGTSVPEASGVFAGPESVAEEAAPTF